MTEHKEDDIVDATGAISRCSSELSGAKRKSTRMLSFTLSYPKFWMKIDAWEVPIILAALDD
jgi:hypothetical protein